MSYQFNCNNCLLLTFAMSINAISKWSNILYLLFKRLFIEALHMNCITTYLSINNFSWLYFRQIQHTTSWQIFSYVTAEIIILLLLGIYIFLGISLNFQTLFLSTQAFLSSCFSLQQQRHHINRILNSYANNSIQESFKSWGGDFVVVWGAHPLSFWKDPL